MDDEEIKLGFIRQIINDPIFKNGNQDARNQIIQQMLNVGVPRETINLVISESDNRKPWPRGCVVENTAIYGNPDDILKPCERDEDTGEILDPINYEPIPENKLVRIRCNGILRCYNIDVLKVLLQNKREDPFTRTPVDQNFINDIEERQRVSNLSAEERNSYIIGKLERRLNNYLNFINGNRNLRFVNPKQRLVDETSSIINKLKYSARYGSIDKDFLENINRNLAILETDMKQLPITMPNVTENFSSRTHAFGYYLIGLEHEISENIDMKREFGNRVKELQADLQQILTSKAQSVKNLQDRLTNVIENTNRLVNMINILYGANLSYFHELQ